MFSNYNNLNTSYNPNNYHQKYPMSCDCNSKMESINPNKPFEMYDMGNNLIGYFWYQGNTLDLTWDIEGTLLTESNDIYFDAASYIPSCELICRIYNFRRELIATATSNYNELSDFYPLEVKVINTSKEGIATNATCTLHINKELSAKLVKGVYQISLTVVHPSGYDETLFDCTDCKFEVR